MRSLGLRIFLLITFVACLLTLLPSCGHTHTPGEWITDNEATCTENGARHTECTSCGETVSNETIPAKGHSYEEGACTVCGFADPEYVKPDAPVCQHELVRHEAKAPTCNDVGWDAYESCSKCDYTTYSEKAALGHDEIAHSAKTPTCNDAGWDAYVTCSRCDYTTYSEKAVLGHDEIAHGAKAPTCNEIGWDAYVTCSRCDYTTYSEKAALGHDELAHGAKAPTCNDTGWDAYVTCSRCDYTTYNEKAALGHNYVDGACTNCGELKPSEGLEYTENEDGKTCYVSGIGTCSDTHIIIPSISPKGYTVTGIGEAAFQYRSHITGITVPNSVMSIGDRAFKNTSLTDATIPGSVKSIGEHAFAGCSSLTSITIPDSVTSIGNNAFSACTALESITIPSNITRIEFNTFSDCEKLTSIVIPNSVTDIGGSAFLRCTSLTSVTIGSNVESIGDGAFEHCTGLTSITIPDSVTSICDSAFSSCTGLTGIIIPDSVISIGGSAFCGCTGFKSVTIGINVTTIGDNAFFGCTGLTSITIPDKVQSIGRLAFRECTGLTSIAIPDSVTSIGETAFASCSGLTSVVIGSGVTTIGWGAFLECSAITEVIYHGTPDEYASISIAEYNDALTSITPTYIHTCTSGEAVKEKVIEATCTVGGSYELVVYCTACGTELSRESVSLDALGHSYVGGTCSRCGALEPNNDLIFVPIDDTTCYVSGTRGDEPTLVIPSFAPDGKKVVKIGNGAFSGDWNITYVILPDTLTSIGDNAFIGCDYLCEISIPAGVTEIGEYAFSGCNMSEITIPSGVKEISKGTFSGCISLEVLHIGSGVTKIGDYAFRGCDRLRNTVIPEGVKEIGENAFNYCDDMTEIVIPSSVTYIGRGAFTNCYFLRSITVPFVGEYMDGSGQTFFAHIFGAQDHTEAGSYIPDSLKSVTVTGGTVIEACAFMECDRINSITLPDTLTTIGDKAFDGCYSLTSIVIPVGVTEIMGQIFSGCTDLTDIKVADGNANYRSVDGSLYSKDGIALITYAPGKTETTFTVPDGVELIIDSAFANCEYITRITFPVSLREIGSAAFLDCSSLRIIDLEEGVTAIGDSAFKGCSLVIVNYNGKRESFDNITGATEAFAGVELVIPHRCEPGQPVIENEIFADCNNAGSYELVTYCADPDCPNGRPEMSRETKSTPALGHNYVDGACTRCGKEPMSEGLVYTDNGDGTCYVSNIGTCTDTDIVIPATSPDGLKVVGIGDEVFKNHTEITGVTLPSTLTYIGNSAFYCCTGISELALPEGVTSIGIYAFYCCSGLKSITIPNSITSIRSEAFFYCDSLKYSEYGNGYYLGNDGNPYLALIRIKSSASFTVNDNTKVIGAKAFYYCTELSSVTIGNSVKTIGEYAFGGCGSIVNISIPDSVVSIEYGAFHDCQSLASITMTGSVTSIGNTAFEGCSALTTVYYNGTPEQYSSIVIGAWNTAFTDVTPTYADGPAESVYTREEGYIYFGEYPQTIKADDVTITDTQDERGYYLGSDNCYYAKVVSAPNSAAYTFSSGKSIEYDTVYYFKVEPIRWKILTESDGKAFLLCDSIIDNKAFDGTSESHSNNYAESDIRAWLNNEFYNTAFSELQREIILTTTVDNSLESTTNSSNAYLCEDTEDKVFLLSGADVMNFNYGFSDLYTSSDYTRTRKSSDYARANGVWMSTYSGSYKGNGYWWLRSPFYYDDKYVYQVDGEGKFYESRRAAYDTVCGVVPAIWITL